MIHRRAVPSVATGYLAVIAAFFLWVPPPPITAQSAEDDLFADVFGDSAVQTVQLPLFLDEQFIGDITAEVAPQRVLVDGVAVSNAVAQRLNDETRGAVDALVDSGDLIDIGEFTPLGLFLTYQPEQARLTLQLAPDVLRERTVGGTQGRRLVNVQEPVPFSAFLNLRGRSVVATEEGADIFQAEIEPVANYRGWVAESLVGLSNDDGDPVELRYARLVRDLETVQIRGEAGIVRYETSPLFGSPELIGVSATRREEIGYGPAIFRDGTAQFVVPQAGPVELYINDRLYQTFRLPPGPHRADDLPLGFGNNTVRVQQAAVDGAADGNEPVVLIDERVYYSPRLVRAGRHTYSGATGIVRDVDLPQALFATGFYRYGVADTVTVGGAAQLSPEEYAVGAQTLFATRIGISRFDVATYLAPSADSGAAVELAHTVSLLYRPSLPSFEVRGRFQSTHYQDVMGTPTLGASLGGTLIVNQRIGGTTNATTALLHTIPLDDTVRRETGVRVGVVHRSPRGYNVSAQIGPTFYDDGTVQWSGSVFLRISTDDRSINTSASYDIAQGPATVQVANAPRRPLQTISWSAATTGFDQRPGSVESLRGTVAYTGYHGAVQVQPRVRRTVGGGSPVAGAAGQYAGAVVWAGGAPMVTRPVEDGFVVFTPRPHIAPYPVPVRPGGGAVSAVVENRGAVLPELPSWGTTVVDLDGSQLPDGFFPGTTPITFRSGYRSGYRVIVGSEATVYISGRLVDGDLEPIGLEAGEIVDAFGNTTLFFTDRDGRFEVIDIAPGEYRLYLFSYPDAQSIFAVPEGETGRYELDDVVFLTEENE